MQLDLAGSLDHQQKHGRQGLHLLVASPSDQDGNGGAYADVRGSSFHQDIALGGYPGHGLRFGRLRAPIGNGAEGVATDPESLYVPMPAMKEQFMGMGAQCPSGNRHIDATHAQ